MELLTIPTAIKLSLYRLITHTHILAHTKRNTWGIEQASAFHQDNPPFLQVYPVYLHHIGSLSQSLRFLLFSPSLSPFKLCYSILPIINY